MLAALARGQREIDCGCFQSALRQRVSAALVVRNMLLALLFAGLLGVPGGAMSAPAVLDGVAAGLALFLLYLAAGMILSLRDAGVELAERFA